MITILQGGVANQLHQYAFGLAQAIRFNCNFQLDVTSFKNDSMRRYSLGLFRGVDQDLVTDSVATVCENGLPYNQSVVDSVKSDSCLRGYWQSELYYRDIRSYLLDRIQPAQLLTSRGTATKSAILGAGERSCFLTIRRTDYVQKQNFHGVLSLEYYEKALSRLKETVKDPILFVFSDEPDWCNLNFKLSHPFYVVGTYDQTTPDHLGREDEDLYLMSLCRHAIMANSSFSYWGAWLYQGSEEGRVVVGPKQWFTTLNEDSRDIIPERWIRL